MKAAAILFVAITYFMLLGRAITPYYGDCEVTISVEGGWIRHTALVPCERVANDQTAAIGITWVFDWSIAAERVQESIEAFCYQWGKKEYTGGG